MLDYNHWNIRVDDLWNIGETLGFSALTTKVRCKPKDGPQSLVVIFIHGSLNVPIEHHPTIRYMVYNGYYKVMSNIPKMGQLPTPVISSPFSPHLPTLVDFVLIRFPRLLWCHNCWMNPEFGNVTHIFFVGEVDPSSLGGL